MVKSYPPVLEGTYIMKKHEPMAIFRTNSGKHYAISNFTPYFLVKKEDLQKAEAMLDHYEEFLGTGIEGKYGIIYVTAPFKVPTLREVLHQVGIETFEADVPFHLRVMIDEEIEITMPKKIMYFDIEVASEGFVPDPEKADQRILTIAWWDNEGNSGYFANDDETETIHGFFKKALEYDAHVTWNGINFDFPYLLNRAKKLGIEDKIGPIPFVQVDLMYLYKRFVNDKLESYALDYVAKFEGFEGKREIDIGKVNELFERKREELIEYNLQDALLLKQIDEKYNLTQLFFAILQISGTTPRLVLNPLRGISSKALIDAILLRVAKSRGIRLPTAIKRKKNEKYTGAYVKDPIKGKHEWVGVLDFNSLYPSIMLAFNISRETWVENPNEDDIKAIIGGFKWEPKGLLVEVVERLFDFKMHLKKLKKQTDPESEEYAIVSSKYAGVKAILNSVYGVNGYQGFRLYKREVAENVTLLGQALIKKTEEYAKELGYTVLYGDTDSLFIQLHNKTPEACVEELEALAEELTQRIRTYAKEEFGANGDVFTFEPDKIFRALALFNKKNYSGILAWKDGQFVNTFTSVGLLKRGDVPKATKDFLKDVIVAVLEGKDYKDVIEDYKKRFFAKELDEDVVIWKSLSKDPNDYKVDTPHVRAYKILISKGHKPTELSKVGYVQVGNSKHLIIPVLPGMKPILTSAQRQFVWRKFFIEKLKLIDVILPKEEVNKGQANNGVKLDKFVGELTIG